MDIDQTRTFLAIVAHGSFIEAAAQSHLTQSTISARVKRLEDELGARLFIRNRAGANLTPAGRRFLVYAKRLVLTADQALDEVGLSERFRASLRIGGRIALWENILPQWVGWMRQQTPDVLIRSEIGFEDDLMPRLIEGSLDIGLMYTPSHSPGLIVEHLFDETLVLVSSHSADQGPCDDYVYIDWGPGFYAQHAQHYPELERPSQTANIGWLAIQLILTNGGSCFLPDRLIAPLVATGQLHRIEPAPTFIQPSYVVYPRESDNPVLARALEGLRQLTDVKQTDFRLNAR